MINTHKKTYLELKHQRKLTIFSKISWKDELVREAFFEIHSSLICYICNLKIINVSFATIDHIFPGITDNELKKLQKIKNLATFIINIPSLQK